MSDIFKQIFGGSDTQAQSTSTPVNMNPFTSSLGGVVNTLGNTLATRTPTYSGPLNADLTADANKTLGTLGGMVPQGGGVAGTNDYLQQVLSGQFLPGQPGGNPFLQAAITAAQRGTMNNLSDTLSRSLPGYFTANGQMISPNNNGQGGSSAFDTAAGIATRGAATTMGDIAATMSSNAYGAERTNQQQAAQLSQQEVQNTISTLQAQTLPTMLKQQGIQNGIDLFKTNITSLLQLLQTLGGITQPVLGQQQQSTSKTDTQTGIIPALGGGTGMGNLIKAI